MKRIPAPFPILLLLFLAVGCKISGNVTLDGVGLAGVSIVLSGDADGTTVTDSEGYYVFDSVDAGTYTVTMQPPPGFSRAVSRRVVKGSDATSVGDVNFEIDTGTERDTDSGPVVGFREEDSEAHAWLGIPYARPPVNGLRWKAPVPAEDWTGSWLALETAPACTQIADLLADVPESDYGQPTGSEDCLYLNVWAPAFSPDDIPSGKDLLPVMVWIHGGGNSVGQGGGYNGQQLASRYGLVVVTLNYRLGPFGWFTHPALDSGDVLDDSGNFGTLDIIRVLKWVKDNIRSFGGDPGNVTVFGESAGAVNTLSMMISPEAAGLFHKAIAESGGISTTEMSAGRNYIEEGGDPFSSREVINRLLIADDLAADRNAAVLYQNAMTDDQIVSYISGKSNDEIMRVYDRGYGGMISFPHLFRDGAVFPLEDPLVLFEDSRLYNAVPLMIGSNRDEMKLFMVLDPEFANIIGGIPLGVKDPAHYALYARYSTDAWKVRGVDGIASVLSETARQPDVFAYRFDWDEEPVFLGVDISFLLGAAHGLEIGFVFHDLNQFIVPRYAPLVYTDENLPGRMELADSMSSYWAEFAYTGNPGRGRDGMGVEWTAWDNAAGGDKFVIFDTSADSGIRMSPDMITMESLKTRLLNESGFTTQEQHCSMYASLFAGTELWNQQEFDNLGSGGCVDADGDGYYWKEDCDDDPSDDPEGCDACTCSLEECAGCAKCMHPGAREFPEDPYDSNCNENLDCFIANAAFGTELEPKIDTLRFFRDQCLMKSHSGRAFVEAYYKHGPWLAERIAERGWLRAIVRTLLLPVVGILWLVI